MGVEVQGPGPDVDPHGRLTDVLDAALPPGSYVMGITPFDRKDGLDEGALRDHIEWMARENVGFWPASPLTGEGIVMTDAELLRSLDLTVETMAGRIPVVAGSREFATAEQNIAFAAEAAARGADAVQLYPPTLGHSFVPTSAMMEGFYDQCLSAIELPIVLSSNFMTGFEVPSDVLAGLVVQPQVAGVFKHHPDQQNVAEFAARFSPHTTVLTMVQRAMFSHAVGSIGELDNLQNIAPSLCRRLHDALANKEMVAAGDVYRDIVRLWAGVGQISAQLQAPRVVIYKAMLGLMDRPGGRPRSPYVELSGEVIAALARLIDEVNLREIEGLS